MASNGTPERSEKKKERKEKKKKEKRKKCKGKKQKKGTNGIRTADPRTRKRKLNHYATKQIYCTC